MVHISAGRDQFFKTKLCPHISAKSCRKGDDCYYAHSEAELRKIPDLRHTRLCEVFRKKGFCLEGSKCDFAHGERELRFTANYHKTDLCKYFQFGYCEAGDDCRHAHGVDELKPRKFDVDEILQLHESGNVQVLVDQRKQKFGEQHMHVTGSATPNILRKLAESKKEGQFSKRKISADVVGDQSPIKEPQQEYVMPPVFEAVHRGNAALSFHHGKSKYERKLSVDKRRAKEAMTIQGNPPVSYISSQPVLRNDVARLMSKDAYAPIQSVPHLMVTPSTLPDAMHPFMAPQTGTLTNAAQTSIGYGPVVCLPRSDSCNMSAFAPPPYWMPYPWYESCEPCNAKTSYCLPSDCEPSPIPTTLYSSKSKTPHYEKGVPLSNAIVRASSEWPSHPQKHHSIPARGKSAPSPFPPAAPPYPGKFPHPGDGLAGMYVLPRAGAQYSENINHRSLPWSPYHPSLSTASTSPGETVFSWKGEKCYDTSSLNSYVPHTPTCSSENMNMPAYTYRPTQRSRSHELPLSSMTQEELGASSPNFPAPMLGRSNSLACMGTTRNSPAVFSLPCVRQPFPVEGPSHSPMYQASRELSPWPDKTFPLPSAPPYPLPRQMSLPPHPSTGICFSAASGPYMEGRDVFKSPAEGFNYEGPRYHSAKRSDKWPYFLPNSSIRSYSREKYPNSSPHNMVASRSLWHESPVVDRETAAEFPTAFLPLPNGVVYDDEIASGFGDVTGLVPVPEEFEYGPLSPQPQGKSITEGRISPITKDRFTVKEMRKLASSESSNQEGFSCEEMQSLAVPVGMPTSDKLPLFSLPVSCMSEDVFQARKPPVETAPLPLSSKLVQAENKEQMDENQFSNKDLTERKKLLKDVPRTCPKNSEIRAHDSRFRLKSAERSDKMTQYRTRIVTGKSFFQYKNNSVLSNAYLVSDDECPGSYVE